MVGLELSSTYGPIAFASGCKVAVAIDPDTKEWVVRITHFDEVKQQGEVTAEGRGVTIEAAIDTVNAKVPRGAQLSVTRTGDAQD